MREIISFICALTIVGAAASSLYGYIFLSDARLKLIAQWMALPFIWAMAILILILAPLSAFRKLRALTQSGFMIVGTVLFSILTCVSPVYVGHTWGDFWVFVGFFITFIGCIPFGFLAALFTGDWPMLILYVICLSSLFGSAYAALIQHKELDGKTKLPVDAVPRSVRDATHAVWMLLWFFVPYGVYTSGGLDGLYLIPVVVVLACALGMGGRWSYLTYLVLAGAYLWILFDKPNLLTVSPKFLTLDSSSEFSSYVNTFGSGLTLCLRINGWLQHAVVVYVALLLLTPSSIRWFWAPPVPVDTAGPRLDKQGQLLDSDQPEEFSRDEET